MLFFGDFFSASIATIGINPSRQEYLSPSGQQLTGSARRFETLNSLGAMGRASLSETQAQTAIERMRRYFDAGKPTYAWFNGLARVVEGMGFSFANGSAAHLDLVQESTDPVWSELLKTDPEQASAVLSRDVAFLGKQIVAFPLRVIVCTSARVLKEVSELFSIRITAQGKLARIKWTVGQTAVKKRVLGVAGWNIPLVRATGLTSAGQGELGKLLSSHLEKAGVPLRCS